MKNERKALLLSIGYGQGHHSAAQALADELRSRGWQTDTLDPCAEAHPRLFRLTQLFYRTCVRKFPRLWGCIYRVIDKAPWAQLVRLPGIAAATQLLLKRLLAGRPDMVVCTYPLFGYMLDAFADKGLFQAPYAIIVTDAISLCRPWLRTRSPLICLPDEHSLTLVKQRYGISPRRLAAPGFPVRAPYVPGQHRPLPGELGEGLHVVYGAHAPLARVQEDVEAMLRTWPRMRLTVLAEERQQQLTTRWKQLPASLHIGGEGQNTAELLHDAHFYVGKAGGATVFEAYCAEVPVLVNYALPGQERGNLQLLLADGAGAQVHSAEELVCTMRRLLSDSAAGWHRMRQAMHAANRSCGAARTVDELERRLLP